MTQNSRPTPVDDYILSASPAARPILKEIRRMVLETVPDAEELISYRMPAYRSGRIFIYFAAFKKHIGIYPPLNSETDMEEDLKPYRGPKGNLKFPLDQPLPNDLICKVIQLLSKQYSK
jgi:uncharacterized protein YdhG (YjbR/CyaY superfamily)